MALRFEDNIENNNLSFTVVDGLANNVRGIYWVATTGDRDLIGDADINANDRRAQYCMVIVGSTPYIYTSSSIADLDWTNAANWKEIASAGGSIDDLSDVDTSSTLPEIGQVLFWDGANWVPENPAVTVEVKNDTLVNFTKGQPVYVSGTHASGKPTVELADANGAGTYPAIGLLRDDLAAGGEGLVIISGSIFQVDTSLYGAGDALYVSNTPGALTTTKPTGTSQIQKVALVKRSHPSNGSLIVMGAGRVNDIPNLPNGQAWIGNASGVATPTTLATVATTGSYTDLLNIPSTFTPSAHTHVSGDITDFNTAVSANSDVAANTLKVTFPGFGTTAGTALEGNTALFDGAYSSLTGIPATFTPSAHTHTAGDITDFDTEVSNNSSVAANTLKVTFPGFGTVAGTALEGNTVLFDGAYSSLTGIPTTFTPSAHTHVAADITNFDASVSANADVAANTLKVTFPGFGTTAGTALEGNTALFDGAYSSLTGIPTTFNPSAHTHVSGDITNFDTAVAANSAVALNTAKVTFPGFGTVAGTALEGNTALFDGAYSSLTGIPTTFAPSAHTHVAADITNFNVSVSANSDVAANTLKVTFPGFGTTAGTALEGNTALFDGAYSSLTGIPTTFTPSAHTHVSGEITDFSAAVAARIASASLEDLSDVVETGTVLGDLLRWDGNNWTNYASSNLDTNLGTTDLAIPANQSTNSTIRNIELTTQTNFPTTITSSTSLEYTDRFSNIIQRFSAIEIDVGGGPYMVNQVEYYGSGVLLKPDAAGTVPTVTFNNQYAAGGTSYRLRPATGFSATELYLPTTGSATTGQVLSVKAGSTVGATELEWTNPSGGTTPTLAQVVAAGDSTTSEIRTGGISLDVSGAARINYDYSGTYTRFIEMEGDGLTDRLLIGGAHPNATTYIRSNKTGGGTSYYNNVVAAWTGTGLLYPSVIDPNSSTVYTLPTTAGSANQVLTTNGAGVTEWQDGPTVKFEQVYSLAFIDDLGTGLHYLPWKSTFEQTTIYQEEAAMLMPYDGKIKSLSIRLSSVTGASGNMTAAVRTIPTGSSHFAPIWTVEETEVVAWNSASDYHTLHFVFSNAQHFEAGDMCVISIQNSVDMGANTYFYPTVAVEYDTSTTLGSTSGDLGSNP